MAYGCVPYGSTLYKDADATEVARVVSNACLRHAIKPEQGIGFYEAPVGNMPTPSIGAGMLTVHDEFGQYHGLIFDSATRQWYDVTTRAGTEESEMVQVWTGKDGKEFERSWKAREDTGESEHDFIRHEEGHIYVRPFDQANEGAMGHDAAGYPSGMEVDLNLYKDGALVPAATAAKVPLDGDIKSDKKVDAHRIQTEFIANCGDHIVINRQQYYVSANRAATPDKRISSEVGLQGELSNIISYPDIINGKLIERRTGKEIVAGFSLANGPEGRIRALVVAHPITFGTVNVTGASFLMFSFGVFAGVVMIGTTTVSLTNIDLGVRTSDWVPYYARGITASGAFTIAPTTHATIAHVRLLDGLISDAAVMYYMTDILDNFGKIVLP